MYVHVCVDLLHSRCGPCKKIAPAFEKLSVKYSSAIFIKLDVDICRVRVVLKTIDIID